MLKNINQPKETMQTIYKRPKEYSVKTMIVENKYNRQKIDQLFFDIKNIETQSQILLDILDDASFTTLQNVVDKCKKVIKLENKGGQ